jgi:pilus assembly protein CpaB
VSAAGRRRRGVAALGLALASGGLAASQVQERLRAVEARTGPLVPVVVARSDLPPGQRLAPDRVEGLLTVRQVPEGFRPPDALASPAEAAGLRLGAGLAAGGYLTASALRTEDTTAPRAPTLAPGERLVEVPVAGGRALTALGGAGRRVDVLVTSEPRDGAGRTWVALERVELVALVEKASEANEGGGSSVDARATLRVSPRQAVFLTAAEAFAREVRLLARAPRDRRSTPTGVVSAGDL